MYIKVKVIPQQTEVAQRVPRRLTFWSRNFTFKF